MSNTLMHFLEELAANAWPPATTQMVDGWRLRYNENVTQRANSVLPNDISGEMRLDERLELVEDFYARHGMRARYQVCPASLPSELDDALAARSYARISDTSVQIAQVENVIEQTGGNKPQRFNVTISGFNDAWMDTYAQGGHMSTHEHAMRRGIVARIGPRAGFALASLDGQPVAVGLGVTERGWTGIFCMETQPAFRRQGAATLILGALAHWGKENGATQMYLQVMVNNAPACALYQRAGFSALYTYWYREASER
jgi:ribosomal protein S18 acetylase RimI-like enzyme